MSGVSGLYPAEDSHDRNSCPDGAAGCPVCTVLHHGATVGATWIPVASAQSLPLAQAVPVTASVNRLPTPPIRAPPLAQC